jgi:hypothetical protein
MHDVCPQPVATPEHSSPRLHSAEDEALTEPHHGADHDRLNELAACYVSTTHQTRNTCSASVRH